MKNEIKLDEFYTLTAEAVCWTLTYEKTGEPDAETGKTPKTRRQTFHATANQALKRYCDNFLKDQTSWHEVIDGIELLNKKIDALVIGKLI